MNIKKIPNLLNYFFCVKKIGILLPIFLILCNSTTPTMKGKVVLFM